MQPTGMRMTSSDGMVWHFDPGTLFVEFMLTGGPDELARYDNLHDIADLEQWAAASRLALGPATLSVVAADLAIARDLRDALWRLSRQSMAGRPAGPVDLATLNKAASFPPLVPQMGVDGGSFWVLPSTASALLSTVARDAIEVLTGPRAARLRECEADDCQLVFLDTSRPGTRRWCSMERCGNRHKVRALRARRATTGDIHYPEA
ncbi:MAG: ABATE domain-containing protein [Nakamurella sp.]